MEDAGPLTNHLAGDEEDRLDLVREGVHGGGDVFRGEWLRDVEEQHLRGPTGLAWTVGRGRRGFYHVT